VTIEDGHGSLPQHADRLGERVVAPEGQ
jgi:hypothetical protein